ncbi:MAG TPA: hypothetical protein PL009_13015 [Flavipsychrobacter sp.]|nr:hypothetical protein [Flavipsychrobacter sp.]
MKQNILVLYYTQSGQLRDILDSLLENIREQVAIDFVAIDPLCPFPFPWNAYEFFDAMPETVERIPIDIKPLPEQIKTKHYDLVILGYQPWFLNPSQPITGFLKSEHAAFLKGKSVLTVVGSRNMWLNAQEEVKNDLQQIGARLVGNIVLTDSYPNIISTLTVIRWAFTGRKEASGMLPAAGVQEKEIKAASRFGTTILKYLTEKKLEQLQPALLQLGAVKLKPGLIILEQRGITNFRKFAKFIRAKGGPGNPDRRGRVLLFKRLLITAIFVLSPISSFTAFIQLQLKKKRLVKDLDYFKSVGLERGRM